MSERTLDGYSGTGSGDFTPDGCAVDLYTRLPGEAEAGIIAAAAPPPATLLELGSGAGRVTRPLLRLGYTVTAVDESQAMLERVQGARKVRSTIEELSLGERFDVVTLGSCLVHTPIPGARAAILETCRRHVADGGCVLIQREGEDWHFDLPREKAIEGGMFRVLSADPVAPGVSSLHAEYVFPDQRWTQTFLSQRLSKAAFEGALAEAGLAVDGYLTAERTWARVVPVGPER